MREPKMIQSYNPPGLRLIPIDGAMESAAPAYSRFRFGVFEIELQTGELRRNGILIHLPPQPFKVMVLLAGRSGQLVTRDEIRQSIWGSDTFVDFEHGLNFAIKRIRDALGDDAESPRYVQTLPRRGYRFIAPVQLLDPVVPGRALPDDRDRKASQPGEQSETGVSPKVGQVASGQGDQSSVWQIFRPASAILIALSFLIVALDPADILQRSLAMFLNRTGPMPPRIESIAILPLENLSGDPEQEYFADGLTDTLITNLGQVLTMRVISRASVLRYKRGTTPLPEIVRELNVDAVVEGTVVRAGNKVRISVQLLDARNDHHLWAETYERNLEDVIDLERQIALAVAHEVTGRLSAGEEIRLAGTGHVNLQAFEAYMRGRRLFAERTAEGETDARGYFEEALRADPNFAPAHSGLADIYSVGWSVKPDYPLAEQFARRAIALDPQLAEGHASLGVADLYQQKFGEARREFQTAISLNPNYALAHNFYADFWLRTGQTTEALAENTRAYELDPFSFPVNAMRGAILWYMGRTDQAIAQFHTVESLNPDSTLSHEVLAHLDWTGGRVREAIVEEKKIAALIRDPQLARDADEVSAVYTSSGFRPALLRDLQLREKAHARTKETHIEHGFYASSTIALESAVLRDREQTVNWLEQAAHDPLGHFPEDLMCAREFDFVRSDPRFQSILRNLGLQTR